MNEENIKQLLEKYWQCNTTPEEEQLLQEFFSGESISKELLPYKSLFVWKAIQQEKKADKKLMKLPEKTVFRHFYPVLRIAAVILVIFTLAIGVNTHYQQEKFMNKVFSDTFTNPEDAVKETGEVLAKVSSLLQLVPERIIPANVLDSLELSEQDITNDSLK